MGIRELESNQRLSRVEPDVLPLNYPGIGASINTALPCVPKKTAAMRAADFPADEAYATATGILPILACHSFGPVVWTEVPWASTATVTGMSFTSNS